MEKLPDQHDGEREERDEIFQFNRGKEKKDLDRLRSP